MLMRRAVGARFPRERMPRLTNPRFFLNPHRIPPHIIRGQRARRFALHQRKDKIFICHTLGLRYN